MKNDVVTENVEKLIPVDEKQFLKSNGMSVFAREVDGQKLYYYTAWSPSFAVEVNITEHFYNYLSAYKKEA